MYCRFSVVYCSSVFVNRSIGFLFFFFFQAEDGIRDKLVTGVQTCALPISVISLQAGRFVPIPFAAMIEPATGRPRTRRVDITSTRYAIARRYMIRLRRDDFDDPHELARFAATAHVSVAEFRRQFQYAIEEEPPPLVLDAVGGRDPGALA